MKKSLKLFAIIIFAGAMAYAASEGHPAEGAEEANEIPWNTISIQAINLGILLVAIVWFTKDSIKAVFKAKKTAFLEEAEKTEAALKLAEAELKEIKTRLAELEASEKASLVKAEKEAIVAAEKLVADSQIQGKKIVQDTSLIISAEVLKAKNQIREKIITQSLQTTEQNIQASAGAITKKSEAGFLQNLGQVNA